METANEMSLKFCWLCGAPLDDKGACTDPTCPLYGTPQ